MYICFEMKRKWEFSCNTTNFLEVWRFGNVRSELSKITVLITALGRTYSLYPCFSQWIKLG